MTTLKQTMPSRADLIRQRRVETSQQRVSRAKQSAVNPARTQPIVVRGSIPSAIPLRNQTKSKVKRQYYVNLQATGAELRLPALPIVNPGWRLLSGVLVIGLLALCLMMLNSQTFTIGNLEINGLQRLTTADIETVLGLNGTSIITVNPQEISEKITTAFPELTNVEVKAGFPAHVTIHATERQPVLAWQNGENILWVDPEGVLIPPRGEAGTLLTIQATDAPPLVAIPVSETPVEKEDTSVLPTVGNNILGRTMDKNVLAAIFQLSLQSPDGTNLKYTTSDGLGWRDPHGWDVYIGLTLEDIDAKLNTYTQIVNELTTKGITPVMVSVEHIYAPFYRTEQ